LRVKGALVTIAALLVFVASAGAVGVPLAFSEASSQDLSPTQNPEMSQQAQGSLGSIASYQGLVVHSIQFTGLSAANDHAEAMIAQKTGTPLDRDLIRESIQALFASGRFADVQVEAERVAGNQVDLIFHTSPNFFVGDIRVDSPLQTPTYNQVANASKLQLGELLTLDKMQRALKNIQQLMAEDGYYHASVSQRETAHPENQQVDVVFLIVPGPQARIGQVTLTGDAGYSQAQVQDMARMHPGDRITADRVTKALQRLRKKYQKQNRLLAQVSIAERKYQPETNAVDYTFRIDRGPTVDIGVEGFKIRRGVLKKNVPVYEEGALDDDLLAEGRRNLLDYLQTRGYFDAKIGIKKQSDPARNELRAIYVIDGGSRHKLLKVAIHGNKYFDDELLRSHLQIQVASRFFSHGRFSQNQLNRDIQSIQGLYRASGFREAQVVGTVDDNYKGVDSQLAVMLQITEGPQTVVGVLHILGNNRIPEDQLTPLLNTAQNQPFSEYNIASDRDSILNYYFNHGFPNATFEASSQPSASNPNLMDVTFTITEGEQFFVNQVLVSGLNHTRPFVVNRELRIKPESPLSQQDMLDTQRRLYDLGIFNQVDTAVQNPDGTQPNKNVLVDIQEAKRYTFDYGLGIEFQTGQPGIGSTEPQGNTGVSPRFSFAFNRLNFRGRNQTITFRTSLGSLQQRALMSFEAPQFLNSKDLRLSFTAFYDNTLDVTTFTSQRLEGSVQLEESLSRVSKLLYRFTYRRVKATNVVVASDEIPLFSQPTRVGMPGFTYIRDKRDNPLETTKGNYTTIDGGVASGYFASEADFGRLLVQNSTYQPFRKNKYVFARSTRIGIENPFRNTVVVEPATVVPDNISLIPLPERFFSGGGNSHRGFGLNQAGPRDPATGFPLGGSALFINNLEVRFPPLNLPYLQDNVSLAIFHDAGNVFAAGHDMLHSLIQWRQPHASACAQQSTANLCSYNYISQAVGVGVRYKTPIGPVRFDFGYNLNPPAFPSSQTINNQQVFVPQHLGHFNVYFSIGQTF
jgi:outer membrane protein insertion porin family